MVVNNELTNIKVIDFGISSQVWSGSTMIWEGTLKFMPPEMISGTFCDLDSKIDTWALGILIYYCIYLKYPFTGSDEFEIKRNICEDKVWFPKWIMP